MRVSLYKSDRNFHIEPGESVLEAALAAGFNLPHSCKTGSCGLCRARLLEGEVRYPRGPPLGLGAREMAEGSILLCEAQARSDLSIDILEVALLVSKRYGVQLRADSQENTQIFRSLRHLAEYIAVQRTK